MSQHARQNPEEPVSHDWLKGERRVKMCDQLYQEWSDHLAAGHTDKAAATERLLIVTQHTEIERLRKENSNLLWDKYPDRMGQ